MKQRLVCIIASLAIVSALGATACGSAPTPKAATVTPPQGRNAVGTLTRIDGNSLTLTGPQGPVTVIFSSSTSVQMTTIGRLSDLHAGDSLVVLGAPDANGNLAATSVVIRPQEQSIPATTASNTPTTSPGTSGRRAAAGTLTRIEGGDLILTTAQGPVTVRVSSNTSVQKVTLVALSELREGQSLSVAGTRDANGNLEAATISIQTSPGATATSRAGG